MKSEKISGAGLKVYIKFDEASGSLTNQAGDITGNATLAQWCRFNYWWFRHNQFTV